MKVAIIFTCVFLSLEFCLGEASEFSETSNNRVKRFSYEAAVNDTNFWLYTQKNPTENQELLLENWRSVEKSNFNIKWPVRVIIHGFRSKGKSKFGQLVKNAYMKKGDFNVIVVNWGSLSSDNFNYNEKTKSIVHIGAVIATFLKFLNREFNLDYNNVYVIGHSLGAHIAGYVGNFIYPGRLNTIFALDPAGPYFENASVTDRIDRTDANYVESIHTNTKLLGIKKAVGHASFYPNFGQTQLGCPVLKMGCSHSRSYKYFAESINRPFVGRRCADIENIQNSDCYWPHWDIYETMGGEPSRPNREGIFYAPIKKINGIYGRPFTNFLEKLSMKLFTPNDINNGVNIWMKNIFSMAQHGFNAHFPCKIILSGVKAPSEQVISIKNQLFSMGNVNVLVLDSNEIHDEWKKTIFNDDLSRFVAQFRNLIVQNFRIDRNSIEIIGVDVDTKIVQLVHIL